MTVTCICTMFHHQGDMQCKHYGLRHTDGTWIGTIALIHNDGQRWGELYAMTDWGNWTYRWDSVEKKGFVKFLRDIDTDYLIGKIETAQSGGMPYMKGLRARVIPAIKLAMEQTVAALHLAGEKPLAGFTAAHDPETQDNKYGYITISSKEATP